MHAIGDVDRPSTDASSQVSDRSHSLICHVEEVVQSSIPGVSNNRHIFNGLQCECRCLVLELEREAGTALMLSID